MSSDGVVEPEKLFADPLGVGVEDAVADVVAQRADVGWPLLHALGKFSCVFLPMAVAGSRNNLTRRLQQSEFHWLCQHDYMSVTRSRSAFATTLTEESAMAAAAMIGESSKPKFG